MQTFTLGGGKGTTPDTFGFGYQEKVRIAQLRNFREDLREDPSLKEALTRYALTISAVERGAEVARLEADGNAEGAAAVRDSKYVSEALLFQLWMFDRQGDYRVVEPILRTILTPERGRKIEEMIDAATPEEVDAVVNFFEANRIVRTPPPESPAATSLPSNDTAPAAATA